MFGNDISALVDELSTILLEKDMLMTSAESCTGGLIGAAMTDRAGSSAVYERGFITYSNESKQELLGVRAETIDTYGAVSRECAEEMALGALKNSRADIAVSVTGIAGPEGGSDEKPIGLVYSAVALRANNQLFSFKVIHKGNRLTIRNKTVIYSLNEIIKTLKEAK
jgi:PncC family amidohydrolase